MGEVLVFTEEHAAGAATLYFRAMRGKTRPPGTTLPQYFCEILLSNPWVSPDIPSLVYIDKGKVVGALGVMPRIMEFQGRPIRVAAMTQFMVDPGYRGPAAIQLLRHSFLGPQDMSWTDGAVSATATLWSALGGYLATPYAFNWIRVLRPFATAGDALDRIGTVGRTVKKIVGLVAAPSDLIMARLPTEIFREPNSSCSVKPVQADGLLDCIHEIGWRESLRPVYTQPSFGWMMSQAAKVQHGDLRMLAVYAPDGLLCGWAIYYVRRGGTAYVLQIGVRRRDHFRETLRALFRDAWQHGAACVKGQSIPQHLTELTEEYCIFRHPSAATLVHSRNSEIANAVRCGEAAITRLDGECWLRFSLEEWP